MKLEQTKIEGVSIIHSEPFKDERGFFNRIFCQKELELIRPGIVIAQINHSMTKTKGTIRGMHFQNPPHAEMKIIRCVKGSIFDVAVDLRKDSPTFLQWHGEILSAENMKALVVPEGCAHGFQSLEDDIEMIYFHTQFYSKQSEGAIRYDEPMLNIQWPLKPTIISERDAAYPFLTNNYKGIL
ncbi:MAG: dTDP-4-dehydrorhamnose 3,5-epimerase [Fibromonadaceae bacterium]|jgi:dTDP-4-dehydrorhamnose 3,5-epimerase|nr:dTDP-4-dehydrorhamnose 3,5-epimerase [Fibromonadaceae bacterium]